MLHRRPVGPGGPTMGVLSLTRRPATARGPRATSWACRSALAAPRVACSAALVPPPRASLRLPL
eukprot:8304819-Alexandrium_andersonii.AAC.1